MGVQANRKIAIVAIHGVGPQQRYVMQDTVAQQLADRLSDQTKEKWTQSVFYPSVNQKPGAAQSYASALRIERKGVSGTVFDVYEAYWSPIDKGHTNVASVFAWILRTVFVPLSTSARLPATWVKLLFDGAYAGVAMLLVLAFTAAAVLMTTWGYSIVAPGNTSEILSPWKLLYDIVTSPVALVTNFKAAFAVAIILAFAGVYLLLQIVNAIRIWVAHPPRVRAGVLIQRGYAKWQLGATLAVLVAAAALIFFALRLVGGGTNAIGGVLAVAVGAIALRLALALAKDFFVNRIGDVQIYCTRDWNSDLHEFRDKITDVVQRTIQQVLDTDEAEVEPLGQYERVYILGHSLGSTIAMDALIRLHQLVEGGALSEERWRRIRGFVTFGTALEKTKFFFDVAHPTLSQSYDQWRGQVYGHLFTTDAEKLTQPTTQSPHHIYWANYWYFEDLVANRIVTYRDGEDKARKKSGAAAEICKNVPLRSRFPLHMWVHSDYISDDAMWDGTAQEKDSSLLDILTAEDKPVLVVPQQALIEEIIIIASTDE